MLAKTRDHKTTRAIIEERRKHRLSASGETPLHHHTFDRKHSNKRRTHIKLIPRIQRKINQGVSKVSSQSNNSTILTLASLQPQPVSKLVT